MTERVTQHIEYADGVTACGASRSPDNMVAWRDEKTESIVHRMTFLLGPGGSMYVACEACVAAHARRRDP